MSSGTSDTWWPGSSLQIDLCVKTETELVQVISEGRSNSRGIKFKSWSVQFPAVTFRGHLPFSYNDLSDARGAITWEV